MKMNFTLPVLLGLSVLSVQTYAKVSIEKQQAMTTYSVNVDDLKLENTTIEGQEFAKATLVGVDGFAGVRHEVGAPEIPVIRFYVTAHSKKDIKVETFSEKANKRFVSSKHLIPVLPSLLKIPGSSYNLKGISYAKSQVNFPEMNYQIADAGTKNGQKQMLVTLYPVKYIGALKTLKIENSFRVTVKEDETPSSAPGAEGFVFIIGSQFKNSGSLAEYMDLKRRMGFNVVRLDVTSSTSADQIRAKLQGMVKTYNLKFGLIIGDADDVNSHESTVITGVTDHYFAALDGDYESDMNAPDLGIGRIAVANEQELAVVLNKYSRYVKGEFTSQNWLNNLSFLATNDRYTVAEGTHNYAIDTYTKKAGYVGIFPKAAQAGGDQLYAITHRVSDEKVQEALGLGRTIIDYSGHGANTFWDAPRVDQQDVRNLKSTSLPFVISNACITGDFRVDESFAETWQRHAEGAVMFWGSMDSSYWDEDDILERRMFDGIYAGGKEDFAQITEHAQLELWKFYGGEGSSKYYRETYLMFGDPSVKLRTSYSAQYSVMGPESVTISSESLSYQVKDAAGKGIANASLVITDAAKALIGSFKSDMNGKVEVNPSLLKPNQKYFITTFGKNLNLSMKSLQTL